MRKSIALGLLTTSFVIASLTATFAQVRYAPEQSPFGLFSSPYDDSYDTHPSYQVFPDSTGYGSSAVRVIQRCAYLDGWNVGDSNRNWNGIPLGVDHTCPDQGGHVRAAY